MLAYVLWHRPAADVDAARYERELRALHASFARRPPVGLETTACLRAPDLPWLGDGGPGYEDWYVVDDWTALGVLRASAIGVGHRTLHDRVARRYGLGTAAVYRLCEGHAVPSSARLAVWVDPPRPGHEETDVVALLFADGVDPDTSGLWRRELVLGPTPQYCLLTRGDAPGTAQTRLPEGWRAMRARRRAMSIR